MADPDFLHSPKLRDYVAYEVSHPVDSPSPWVDPRVVDFLVARIEERRGQQARGSYEDFRRSVAVLIRTARITAVSKRGSRRVTLADIRAAYGRQFCKIWPFC